MQLTSYSDYCLRVLIYLALKHGERATIDEIADRYKISRNHLMKAVNHLARLNYIESIRGKGGGICLHLPPESISIGRVVRATEPDFALVECFRPDNQCCITPACRLKDMLAKAFASFIKTLDEFTLADALEERTPLKRLLKLTPAADEI